MKDHSKIHFYLQVNPRGMAYSFTVIVQLHPVNFKFNMEESESKILMMLSIKSNK